MYYFACTCDKIIEKLPKICDGDTSEKLAYCLTITKQLDHSNFITCLVSCNTKHENYVCKFFPSSTNNINFKNELNIINVKHNNIADVVYYCENDNINFEIPTSYVLFRYYSNDDLAMFINKYNTVLSEDVARTIFCQIVDGVDFLHKNNIAHLDLKIENIVMDEKFVLKIIDFEKSAKSDCGKTTNLISKGTCDSRAPEVKNSVCKHLYAADVYSLGIILFNLVCKTFPYREKHNIRDYDLFSVLGTSLFWELHHELNKNFIDSHSFKDLFDRMTQREPMNRITISDIKKHKWFNGRKYSQDELEMLFT